MIKSGLSQSFSCPQILLKWSVYLETYTLPINSNAPNFRPILHCNKFLFTATRTTRIEKYHHGFYGIFVNAALPFYVKSEGSSK